MQNGKTFCTEIDHIINSLTANVDKDMIIENLEESKKQGYELRLEPKPDIQKIGVPDGWRCPVCGGGNSPYATRCPCIPYYQPPYVTPVYPFSPHAYGTGDTGDPPYVSTHA